MVTRRTINYLALGDSISIDDYTGVVGGGAASQFAKLIRAGEFHNLTRDGNTTDGVLESLNRLTMKPEVVTVTAGGNDFLLAASWGADPRHNDGRTALVERPLNNLGLIANSLQKWRCPIILNTIYDPTDGNDVLGETLGISPSYRPAFYELNEGIRSLARTKGFLLADLHALFHGHGIDSAESWIVGQIEPNFLGATAIARHWFELFDSA